MSKVIDTVSYNGEQDLLEIRLNILNEVVDQFIIVEAPTTFSGKPKPLYYEQQKERFRDFWPKIKSFVIDENYTPEEIALAESSPNTQGAAHWKHEFLQKESIKKTLTHLQDEDIVFIGDCDEIWEPAIIGMRGKLRLKVYTYWLNNRSSENFYGTIVYPYQHIKNECLNHLRVNATKDDHFSGWHFTSMGGPDELRRKLTDSYTEETYAHPQVLINLEENMEQSKDFLGRNFTYKLDEVDWPQYLKDNREKYKHLIKT
jgi:beta-1,4-mannosyl-glycoprotein beta-1,4-N-acetylglucosaminyltransferase